MKIFLEARIRLYESFGFFNASLIFLSSVTWGRGDVAPSFFVEIYCLFPNLYYSCIKVFEASASLILFADSFFSPTDPQNNSTIENESLTPAGVSPLEQSIRTYTSYIF